MNELYINTPLIESLSVGAGLDARVWLKLEAMQPCGSFKARGIGFACKKYLEQGATALVSSSGGNAGLAVAYAGRLLGVSATVVVPQTTKKRAIDLIRREGAEVIVHGKNWDEAHQRASLIAQDKAAYIHPFDDPAIWEGHISLMDEICDTGVRPDVIVLSVGGGGLLCGVVEGLKRHTWHDVPVVAVETVGADCFSAACRANEHIAIDGIDSIATSLGAKKVAKRAFELRHEHQIYNYVVPDKDALDGCNRFLEDHRILVEPACGASLSVVYNEADALSDRQNIVVIVCGGVGVTVAQLKEWNQLFLE